MEDIILRVQQSESRICWKYVHLFIRISTSQCNEVCKYWKQFECHVFYCFAIIQLRNHTCKKWSLKNRFLCAMMCKILPQNKFVILMDSDLKCKISIDFLAIKIVYEMLLVIKITWRKIILSTFIVYFHLSFILRYISRLLANFCQSLFK